MRAKSLLLMSMVGVVIAGCDSGGINLNVATTNNSIDNSTNGGGGGSTNPCASYVDATNTTFRGSFDGVNCVYDTSFVSATKPLAVNMTVPLISGVHIFQGELFVGENVSSGAAPAEGTGPTLTIAAGNTIAFTAPSHYVLINRGSRIIADGTEVAPITFTGYTDAVSGTAAPEANGLWGGIVINGNGITNRCTDAARAANQCHVVSEGRPSNYGGSTNSESSGVLRYVLVKHAGYEVISGSNDELNGITFNAVGSGTTVENVEVYSSFDDGVEFFGGAVNVRNYIALYVNDDSIDFSDGYSGSVTNALVIHSEFGGNNCVEGDNAGAPPFTVTPVSNPTISNMTCIMSSNDGGVHGNSSGVLLRRGTRAEIRDSIVFAGFGLPSSNVCFEINGTDSLALAAAGNLRTRSTIVACNQPGTTTPSPEPFTALGTFANNDTVQVAWLPGLNPSANGANYSFNTNNVVITDAENANVRVLTPQTYFTATQFVDPAATNFSVTPVGAARIGAVLQADDWTAGWTYGLKVGSRGQVLWFE